MNPLVQYYLRQAGRGSRRDPGGIGPVYDSPLYLQRGHGIGSFLGGLFGSIRPLVWSGDKSLGKATVKALGQETLRTGGRILSDIADKTPDISTSDIISKHVTASTQNLISKLRGQGRKRKRAAPKKRKPNKKIKIVKSDKRDIFS
jgi:hypothetical protein